MNPILLIVILGIIEGLTEFLPVSSTGHLVLAGAVFGLPPGSDTFKIVIQLGAILAIIVIYWRRFLDIFLGLLRGDPDAIRFTRNILVGFLPAAVVGALAYGAIRALLNAPIVVGVALVLGGIAILIIERMQKHVTTTSVETMSFRTAAGIGLIQCIAMIPGVSRSGATIMGALLLGVERRTAAEYSFFLAVPTMIGATVFALWSARDSLQTSDMGAIALGFATAFVVALVVVRWFLGVVTKHGYAPFAWYRIVLGSIAILWFSTH